MTRPPLETLIVAGIMSGTSADGIDIALVRIGPVSTADPETGGPDALTLELLAHRAFPFCAELRRAVLAAQDARATSTAALARLHWRLGLSYAEAYRAMMAELLHPLPSTLHPLRVDLVGCHGQTIYHQAAPEEYAGERFACTWQIGEMAPLAREAGVPVISNFRPVDMVLGGEGAPLVPLLDLALYRHPERTRVLQNIGGIGNLTVVPPAGRPAPILAFDTGPGNMVMDALMSELFNRPYDADGAIAAAGRPVPEALAQLRGHPFFSQQPPRSAGREQFGPEFAARLLRLCREHTPAPSDAIATATALTADSIAEAFRRFVLPVCGESPIDLIVSGGGAKNLTLLRMLTDRLAGVRILRSDDPSLPTPLPVEAKEAAAFALLAYMSRHRRAGNVPSATGASGPAILGQVTCA